MNSDRAKGSCIDSIYLQFPRKNADNKAMRASRRGTSGITFIEVMTSMACLALVSASLVGGLAFATERTEIARQRSLVAQHLHQRLEALRAERLSATTINVSSTASEAVTDLPHPVSVSQTAQEVAGKPGLTRISLAASWTARLGTRTSPQEVRMVTQFISQLPQPVSECLILVPSTALYLRQNLTTPGVPVIIDLQAYGLMPGSAIRLQTSGTYFTSQSGGNPAVPSSSLIAMFASQPSLTTGALDQHRVPFAVDGGTDFDTSSHNTLGADCTEDFLLGSTALVVTIPRGGRYLIVGVLDDISDNSGSIQLEVRQN
jgi:type II secretory pathway pseudopilin PulG